MRQVRVFFPERVWCVLSLRADNGIGTPLRPKDAPKILDQDIVRELITTETIYNCIAAPASRRYSGNPRHITQDN